MYILFFSLYSHLHLHLRVKKSDILYPSHIIISTHPLHFHHKTPPTDLVTRLNRLSLILIPIMMSLIPILPFLILVTNMGMRLGHIMIQNWKQQVLIQPHSHTLIRPYPHTHNLEWRLYHLRLLITQMKCHTHK